MSTRLSLLLSVLVVVSIAISSTVAFTQSATLSRTGVIARAKSAPFTRINMGFGLGDEDEPKKLTRENEPEDYFATNMDKMSDTEKLPVALAGLFFVSLPFIAGLIALYAAK